MNTTAFSFFCFPVLVVQGTFVRHLQAPCSCSVLPSASLPIIVFLVSIHFFDYMLTFLILLNITANFRQSQSYFLKNLFCFQFIYFCLCWVFIAVHGLSLVAAGRDYSSLQCAGFSLQWLSCCGAGALGVWASVVVARGLSSCGTRALECRLSSCGSWAVEHRLSSCGARAQLLRSMWDLPRPGLEPVSPALAGRFLTTAPPGKPHGYNFFPGISLREIICLNIHINLTKHLLLGSLNCPRDVVVRISTVKVLPALPTPRQIYCLVPMRFYFSSFGIYVENQKKSQPFLSLYSLYLKIYSRLIFLASPPLEFNPFHAFNLISFLHR